MKLSVVIPVYNAAPYLRECLDSVLAAARTVTADGSAESAVELVCVDDGSTDGSGGILDGYASDGSRAVACRVFHQANAGVSAARNRALEAATGEWIAFVDADDTVSPDWFAQLLARATADVDIVHADARYCFEGVGSSSGDVTYRTFLRDGWTVLNLVRRSLVRETRFRVGLRFKEDVVFFAALGLKTTRITCVRARGYHYRRHVGSAVEQRIRETDSLAFCSAIQELGLPREDAGRTIGFDLVLWVKGRDWSKGYDPAACPVLAFWRRGIASGALRLSDVRWWWRPGLRHWLRTGDLGWLVRTRDWRVRLECWAKGRRVAYPELSEPPPPAELRVFETPSFSEAAFRDGGSFVAVVLAYEQAGRAGAALRSALEQDWPCYEVLAMDDASRDGTADELKTEVLRFLAARPEKPLRVRYVRNAANRTTLGQWRQAVRLSSGEWFGMFCGDDVSQPNRLSVVAETIVRHAQAVAVCTNFIRSNTGKAAQRPSEYERTAEALAWDTPDTMYGCSTFWHRKVLVQDLPMSPLDDFTLTWVAVISGVGSLVWNFNAATVVYSVGTGITTEFQSDAKDSSNRFVRKYRQIVARHRHGKRFGHRVWTAIREFDLIHGKRPEVTRMVHDRWIRSIAEDGAILSYLKMWCRVLREKVT